MLKDCEKKSIVEIRSYVKKNNLDVKARSKKELCDKLKKVDKSSPKKSSPKKSSPKKSPSKKSPLLVVFDLDETLLQYSSESWQPYWQKQPDKIKNITEWFEYDKTSGIMIFRNHLRKFLEFAQDNNITIGFWTLSENSHAEEIAEVMIDHFDLPQGFIITKYGQDTLDWLYDEYPDLNKVSNVRNRFPEISTKDLRYIWKKFPQFNQSNTFLVDDRAANVMHDVNRNNAIFAPPFAPFGRPYLKNMKGFDPKNPLSHKMWQKDKVFLDLISICEKILANPMPDCLKGEEIFSHRRVKELGLEHLLRKWEFKKKKELMTVSGSPKKCKVYIPEKLEIITLYPENVNVEEYLVRSGKH